MTVNFDVRDLSAKDYEEYKRKILNNGKPREAPAEGAVDVRTLTDEEYSAAKTRILK